MPAMTHAKLCSIVSRATVDNVHAAKKVTSTAVVSRHSRRGKAKSTSTHNKERGEHTCVTTTSIKVGDAATSTSTARSRSVR